MTALLAGRLLRETTLTPRDIVLGGLLTLHWELSTLDGQPPTVPPARPRRRATDAAEARGAAEAERARAAADAEEGKAADLVFAVLREMVAATDEVRLSTEHAYGIPSWLRPAGGAGGAPLDPTSRLLAGLADPERRARAGWRRLAEQMEKEALTGAAQRFHAALRDATAAAPRERLRQLREGGAVGVDGSLEPREGVTARTGAAPSRPDVEEAARLATRDRAQHVRELGWRLLRVDFPIVVERRVDGPARRAGVLIGAEVGFEEGTPEVSLSDEEAIRGILDPGAVTIGGWWQSHDASFRRAVAKAVDAATRLLEDIGVTDVARYRAPRVRLRGVLPTLTVEQESIALPLALEILRRALELPRAEVVATGTFERDGYALRPLDAEDVALKHAAVLADGLHRALVVAAAPVGAPAAAGDGGATLSILPPGATLSDAARATWGAAFDASVARRKAASLVLRPTAEQERFPRPVEFAGAPIRIELEQARQIAAHFRGAAAPQLVFLGGPANTGKTWIAHQVWEALAADPPARDRADWCVAGITLQRDEPLPEDVRDLQKAARTALACHPRERARRRLLVLDGLEVGSGLDGVEGDLKRLVSGLRVDVLAVVRTDGYELPSIEDSRTYWSMTREDLGAFLEAAVARYPALAPAADLVGTVRGEGEGDAWWCLSLLMHAAERGPGSRDRAALAQAFVSERLAGIGRGALEALRDLAVLSWFGIDAPARLTQDLDPALLRRVGGVPRGDGRWRIASRASCAAIAGAFERGPAASVPQLAPRVLEALLRSAAEHGEHALVAVVLERVDHGDPAVLGKLLGLVAEPLHRWATTSDVPAVHLARTILALGGAEELRGSLEQWIARLAVLVRAEVGTMTARDVAACLRVARRWGALEEKGWRDAVAEICAQLDGLLGRTPTAIARGALLDALSKLYSEQARRALATHAKAFLVRTEHPDLAEYGLALKLLLVLRALERRGTAGEAEAACRAAAEADLASPHADVDAYLARLALRRALRLDGGGVTRLVRTLEPELIHRIEGSSAGQLAHGLRILSQQDRGLAVALLAGRKVADRVTRQALDAGEGEMATILGALTNLHPLTAHQVLHSAGTGRPGDGPVPQRAMAWQLAQSIKARGDAKGAGRLIQAAAHLDDLFGSLATGFARQLSDHLGKKFVLEQLLRDPRPSVLTHLLEGLASVEAPFAPEAWERVCDAVAESIRLTLRPWGPRLAILMCESPQLGAGFAARLADRVTPERIVEGMTRARDVVALEHFHRMSFLFPGAPVEFERAWRSDPGRTAGSIAGGASAVLRAIGAVAGTLRRAGNLGAAQEILAALGRRQFDLVVLRPASGGQLAETLHLMSRVDGRMAEAAARADHNEHALVTALTWAQAEPQEAMELLAAVDAAAPGRAAELIRRLGAGAWGRIVEGLRYEQNPRVQGKAFLQLARIGVPPADEVREDVRRQLASVMPHLRSPQAISTIVRLLSAWDARSAADATRGIVAAKLRDRLLQRCRLDLEGAVGLVASLIALGSRDLALGIADTLLAFEPSALPLTAASRLVGVLWLLEPSRYRSIAERVADRAAADAGETFVLDDEAHWRAIGWSAYWCAQVVGAGAVSIPGRPASLEIPKDPGTRLWATAWIAPAPWVVEERHRALEALRAAPESCAPGMRLPALAAAARIGGAGDLLRALEALPAAARGRWIPRRPSPEQLLVALEAAGADAALGAWLDASPASFATLAHPASAADPFAAAADILLRDRRRR